MSKRFLVVAAAVTLYVVAVWLYEGPVRPLFDGLGPPAPYNYVSPPPDLADDNIPAASGGTTLDVTAEGNIGRTVATDDGQALVIIPTAGIELVEPEGAIEVELVPHDLRGVPAPPDGLLLYGNVYEVTAAHASGEPAELTKPITLVMRYPVHATVMLQLDGEGWKELDTDVAMASLQLFADADGFGSFVAAGPPIDGGRPWIPYVAGGLALVAAVAGYLTGRRRGRVR